jgi:hypothetical protein
MRSLRTHLAVLTLFSAAACSGGSGDPDAGVDAGVDPDAGADANEEPDCSGRNPLPVDFQILEGFTSAEDFGFDAEGRYVAVGEEGDLIAIEHDGTRHLLVPGVAGGGAGSHFLPNGNFIVASGDVLLQITPEGSITTLISGLQYPNGMDVARDGTIYVAEQNAGRLRAVNPETGEFSIVALGMMAPNGVAIAPDGDGVFVGSFGGGVVYLVDLTNPAPEGRTRIFGRTPGGESTPEPVSACAGLEDGDDCNTGWSTGRCQMYGGALDCQPVPPCEGATAGDACFDPFIGNGTCEDDGNGGLICTTAPPCAEEGDTCTTWLGTAGVCSAELACLEVACAGLEAGDACTLAGGGDGVCQDWGSGELFCIEGPQCTAEGQDCTISSGGPGVCTTGDFGLECMDAACVGHDPGDACVDWFGHDGICAGEGAWMYCYYEPPCDFAADGDPCVTDHGVAGTCDGTLIGRSCQPTAGCGGAASGDPCVTDVGLDGHCEGGGTLACVADDTCAGLAAGDDCRIDVVVAGTCVDDDGDLGCVAIDPCTSLPAGSSCSEGQVWGTCQDTGGATQTCVLELEAFFTACDAEAIGATCEAERFGHVFTGTCIDVPGALFCDVPDDSTTACDGLEEGDACESASPINGVYSGTCQAWDGEQLYCGGGGGGGGGLDGLNVDACGYVYVTEYVAGIIWRIDPQGVTEDAAHLPSSWIPNMHWGPGIGGFESNILYVADRDQGRLFGLELGVPGAHE